ncbi:MAG TPA: metallophosphoesterase [Chthonomonadaceae bacterium]|nr:metallophosphoesterase [Chthonomonadaceae bacterium]
MAHDYSPDPDDDGIDRRGFLKCMAWAGTGMLWTLAGGTLKSYGLGRVFDHATDLSQADFTFVQISDSHIGFDKAANPNVVATMQEAVAKIRALPTKPEFLLHTGDLSHLSKPEEFDTVSQLVKDTGIDQVHYVPGEHDVLSENGKAYRERFGKGTLGDGWYSFDHRGVHGVGLVNVMNLKPGGFGALGPEQLAWLERDLKKHKSSTPIVVFAHVPLWTVYPDWGWGTEDSAQALSYLKRFGSVTVLNGHIHQTMQKVEGNITFHTAMSTAFPQPRPGTAPSPGPLKVPAETLRSVLGLTRVDYVEHKSPLAIVDTTLASATASQDRAASTAQVKIDNFQFAPTVLTVAGGTKVTWINHDDMPHTIVETNRRFASAALDTNDHFAYTFLTPGTYTYFCSIHPRMVGKIIVR